MAGEIPITVVGNLTADPNLRYTQLGIPVASFTVASTPRHFDRQANEWRDGEPVFLNASVWRDFADNVAGSLVKGSRVVVSGRLKQRSYESKTGEKHTVIEMDVDDLGPSLKYATAQVNRISSTSNQGNVKQNFEQPWSTFDASKKANPSSFGDQPAEEVPF